MKVKDLKKDIGKSVRINGDVEQILTSKGYTVQEFLDMCLDKYVLIEIKDNKLNKRKK